MMVGKSTNKTRELQNHHFDSTIWNEFNFRDDDIIATYAKSGTTWVQQIIAQLLYDDEEGLEVADKSPRWICVFRLKKLNFPWLKRRHTVCFIKTHLPVDALVFSDKTRYIGRDGRDVLWSMFHHHTTTNDAWYEAPNDTPGRVGPPIEKPSSSVTEYFHDWLNNNGHPWWPFWENVNSWWVIRNLPNVCFAHFESLKKDMPGEIRRIAAFLETPIVEDKWESILLHCSFDYMKANATKSVPLGGAFWDGGAQTFINRGVQWTLARHA